MQKSWIGFANAQWFEWTPLPGLDPSLGEKAMWLAAAKYADRKAKGRPERECQNAAEKVAFEYHYNVKY